MKNHGRNTHLIKFEILHSCNSQLPKYLIRHLQGTQNTVAGYVLGRYVKESDFITTLGWLSVQEIMEFAIAEYTFSALKDPK